MRLAINHMCHRLVFQFCMSQRQYYQITNATKHLQTTFLTLKNKFLGMIDYWDETPTIGNSGGGRKCN